MSTLNLSSPLIPAGTNPYSFYQQFLVNRMYPVVSSGFSARMIVLMVLLAYTVLISCVSIAVTLIDYRRKGKAFWLFKIVSRPAGRYLAINQYLLYPLASIVTATVWLVYTHRIANMWGGHRGSPVAIFYWIALSWVPFYVQMWSTTSALLSAANLSSVGKNANTHFLSPVQANISFVFLLPIVVAAMIAVGVWTGWCWALFATKWQATYDALDAAALRFGMIVDPTFQDELYAAEIARGNYISQFIMTQHSAMIVYIIAASLLVIINIVGLFTLLRTLRQIARFQSGSNRVIPLPSLSKQISFPNTPTTPTPSSPGTDSGLSGSTMNTHSSSGADERSPSSEGSMTKEKSKSKKGWKNAKDAPAAGTAASQPAIKLMRLELDIKLFFFAVVPASVIFMIFSLWLGTSLLPILSSGALLELATIGFVWAGAVLSLVPLTILTVKTVINLRRSFFSAPSSSQQTSSHESGNNGGGGHSFLGINKGRIQIVRLPGHLHSDIDLDIKPTDLPAVDSSSSPRTSYPSQHGSPIMYDQSTTSEPPFSNAPHRPSLSIPTAASPSVRGGSNSSAPRDFADGDEEMAIGHHSSSSTTATRRYPPESKVFVTIDVDERAE